MKENVERSRRIYELWSLGYTIEEISSMTGIPRSTVGYYVKKFKKKHEGERRGLRPIALETEKSEPASSDVLGSMLVKALGFQKIKEKVEELMGRGEYEKLYYFLMSIKCLIELCKYFKLTPEELKSYYKVLSELKTTELKRNLNEAISHAPSPSEIEKSRRKSLEEILQ